MVLVIITISVTVAEIYPITVFLMYKHIRSTFGGIIIGVPLWWDILIFLTVLGISITVLLLCREKVNSHKSLLKFGNDCTVFWMAFTIKIEYFRAEFRRNKKSMFGRCSINVHLFNPVKPGNFSYSTIKSLHEHIIKKKTNSYLFRWTVAAIVRH